MNHQIINTVASQTRQAMWPMPEGWKFRPNGWLAWLQKLAWLLLEKTGALKLAYEPRDEIHRFEVNSDDLMHKIMLQNDEVSKVLNRDCDRMYIGARDFADLMHRPDVAPYMHMHATYCRNDDGVTKFLGMRVTIVPWMRGVLCVPKD